MKLAALTIDINYTYNENNTMSMATSLLVDGFLERVKQNKTS